MRARRGARHASPPATMAHWTKRHGAAGLWRARRPRGAPGRARLRARRCATRFRAPAAARRPRPRSRDARCPIVDNRAIARRAAVAGGAKGHRSLRPAWPAHSPPHVSRAPLAAPAAAATRRTSAARGGAGSRRARGVLRGRGRARRPLALRAAALPPLPLSSSPASALPSAAAPTITPGSTRPAAQFAPSPPRARAPPAPAR